MLPLHSLIPALRPSGLQQSLNGAYYLLGAPGDIAVWETITFAIKANVRFISAFFGHKFWDDIVLQLGRPFTLSLKP